MTSSVTTVVTNAATLSLPPKNRNRIMGYKNKHGAKNRIKKIPDVLSNSMIKTNPKIRDRNPESKMLEVFIEKVTLLVE